MPLLPLIIGLDWIYVLETTPLWKLLIKLLTRVIRCLALESL